MAPSPHNGPRPIFVIGKGGVGKSTVAAGLALASLADHRGAVLIEFGEGKSAARVLTNAPAALQRVVIRIDDAVERAARPLFGSALLARIALQNFAVKPLIRATPALRELAVLELVRQVVADNPGRRVVVDMPATGHGLAWLQVAEKGRGLFLRGPLYQLCDRLRDELLCPARCEIVVVTLPERLVLLETMQLCKALVESVGLPAGRLIINRLPALLTERARTETRKLAEAEGPLALAAGELLTVLEARHELMNEVMGTLEGTMAKDQVVILPLAITDPSAEVVAGWLRQRGAA